MRISGVVVETRDDGTLVWAGDLDSAVGYVTDRMTQHYKLMLSDDGSEYLVLTSDFWGRYLAVYRVYQSQDDYSNRVTSIAKLIPTVLT